MTDQACRSFHQRGGVVQVENAWICGQRVVGGDTHARREPQESRQHQARGELSNGSHV